MLGVSTKNTFFEKSTCEEYIDQYHKMLQKTQKKTHQFTRRRNFSIFHFQIVLLKSHLQTHIKVSLL